MKICAFCGRHRQVLVQCNICKRFFCGLCTNHHTDITKGIKEDKYVMPRGKEKGKT